LGNKRHPEVERALEALRVAMRQTPVNPPPGSRAWPVPEDLQTEEVKGITVTRDERKLLDAASQALSEDMRFEHLEVKEIGDAVWRFACQAALRTKEANVAQFITDHAIEPTDRVVYFPVTHLKVAADRELFGVRFLRADSVVPPAGSPFWPDPAPTMASVIAVPCVGATNYTAMRRRARRTAEHALRLLRVALREHNALLDRQLRFGLGEVAWLDGGLTGWETDPATGWEMTLDDGFVELATGQAISSLRLDPDNDVERRANRALRWYERAQLSTEPTVELLFLFFALETILGDKSNGLKGALIARRRATLGAIRSEQFAHPIKTYVLYDEVRSNAVHGEEPPEVPGDELLHFRLDVRRSINDFLEYARANGLVKRKRVTDALEASEQWQTVRDVVRPLDPEAWDKCFGVEPE
jgi:hypothetical protein